MKTKTRKILSLLLVLLVCFSVLFANYSSINVAEAKSNYTVDFKYLDKEVKILGDSKEYNMNNIFSSLGINEEITDIQMYNLNKTFEFTNNIVLNSNNEIIFDISRNSNTWLLNSYMAFSEEFIMIANSTYEIKVTDPKTDPRTYPTKDTDYTYSYDALEDGDVITYQWMRNGGYSSLTSDSEHYTVFSGTVTGNTVSSVYDPGFEIYIVGLCNTYENCRFTFDYEGDESTINNCDILSHEGDHYIIRTYSPDVAFLIESDSSFEITNVKLGVDVAIPNQTSTQITLTQDKLGDYDYFITNKINGTYIVGSGGSEVIHPKEITFDVNDDSETNELTGSIYQFEGRKVILPLDSFKKTGYKCVGFTDGLETYETEYTVQEENYTLYPVWEEIISTEPSESNKYTVGVKDKFSKNAKYQWCKATEKWVQDSTYYCNYSNGRTVDPGTTVYLSSNAFLRAGAGITKLRFKLQGTGSITNCTVNKDGYYYPPYNSSTGVFDITGTNPESDTYITNIEVISYTYTPISGLTNKSLTYATGKDLYACRVTLKTGDIAYSSVVSPKKFGNQPQKEDTNKDVENNNTIIYSENKEVSFETSNGFNSDITLRVEVISNTIANDDPLLVNTVSLKENEKIGVVFNVKLIQTINGESIEIQPSDIKEGTVIKVKMLIPDYVDIDNVTRLLHIHSLTDIEEFAFDKDNIDENGYYSLDVTKLSHFAFIYKDVNGGEVPEEKDNCIIHWFLLAILILELVRVLMTRNRHSKGKELRDLVIYFISIAILVFLASCKICTIFIILNAILLVALLLTCLLKKNEVK